MITKKVKFDTTSAAQKFCDHSMNCGYDLDFVSGRYVIDGKSILGILSLDLSKPVDLKIHVDTENECADFINAIRTIDGISVE